MAPDAVTESPADRGTRTISGRWFLTFTGAPRARRPSDAMAVLAGVFLVTMGIVGAGEVTEFESGVADFLGSLPGWGQGLFTIGYALSVVYALAVLVAAVLGGRRRREILRDLIVALVAAVAVSLILIRLIESKWPVLLPEFTSTEPTPEFPVFRVVLVTALLATAAPHVIRPLRRIGWLIIAVVTVASMGLGFGFPSDAFGAVGLGLIAAGAVLLRYGSPRGYPQATAVAQALHELGVTATGLRVAPTQSWGARLFWAEDGGGRRMTVKAYGRDATESQFFAKAWRSIWFRDTGPSVMYSRLQGVEHEALMTMLAAREGVATPTVRAAGEPGEDVALLVVDRVGVPIRELDAASIRDDMLAGLWEDVGRLHAASMAHGSLSVETAFESDGRHLLTDFAFSSVGAPDMRLHSDVVELMFSLATVVGAERAASTALQGLGAHAFAAALPYLQLATVSNRVRKAAGEPKELMRQLQQQAEQLTDIELPEQAQIKRISTRQLVMTGLMLLAAYALISMLADLDWVTVGEALRGASWAWIVAAFAIGQGSFVFEATAMVAAVGEPLPARPVLVLQVASKYISLAIPGAAGRVATNTAFLRKFGVSATSAVTQGGLDTLSGFLVEASIIALVLIFGDIEVGADSGDRDWGLIVALVIALIIAGVIVVRRVAKIRERVLPVVREILGAFTSLFETPRRALNLLGSNVLSRLVLGTTLAAVLVGLGSPIGPLTGLVVVVASNLLAGLAPVPGGIGVAEAVLTAGLVAVGVDDNTAFAGAVVYRMITFYIPAVVGWYAVRWEEARGYL